MFYHFCVFIQSPHRVDMYLSNIFKDFSRSYVQKMIDKGQLQINGNIITKNSKINNRDEIILTIKLEKLEVNPEKIDLDIIYEDDNILIVNKDPYQNVHPVPGEHGKTGTLVNAVLYHCDGKLGGIGGVERPGIVHRLDKDTSGVMMVAKNDEMMKYLQEAIADRKLDKYYLAIVEGIIEDKEFKIESFIGRDRNDRMRMTIHDPINPKRAITLGEVVKYIENKYTLVKVKILTGRTHQIRVHLASIGYPIIGDKVYGKSKTNKEVLAKYGLDRQALHSYILGVELYGKYREFTAELKEDMKKIIG